MVMDTIARGAVYEALHPAFPRAFQYLSGQDLAALPDGRYELDGDRLFVLVMTVDGRGREDAKPEVHRRYIDIQAVIRGEDVMGWRPLCGCTQPLGFDNAKDVGFFGDAPASWITVHEGSFALFYPEDVHAPLAGMGTVKKAVVKVAVSE